MAQLPDFEHGKWRLGSGIKFFRRHPHGIFKISGYLADCPYGSIQTHAFKRAQGRILDLWTTGYEITEALRSGELRISRIIGYGWEQGYPKGKKKPILQGSAFARFVADFYALRSATQDPALKYFYKLILNSLYGKFIQRTRNDEGEFVAGSMFDPSIASLITGYVRAKIHRLEHKYKALHTATDGFITRIKPDPADIGSGIGQLKADTFGPVLIMRNKLYLHFDHAGKLKKSGLHGFQGNPAELEALWRSSKRIYSISHLVKWAEAWHVGLPPGTPIKNVKRTLRI